MERKPNMALAIAFGFIVSIGLLGLSGCGTGVDTGTSLQTQATPGPTSTTAAVSASESANNIVGEAVIGTAGLAPGNVVMSEGALSFVPPTTFPVYRVPSFPPATREMIDARADVLGLSEPRTYEGSTVSDGHWRLQFDGDDLNTFTLEDTLFEAEIMKRVEAGETLPTLTPEEVRRIADDYLRSTGYAEGLQFREAGIRQSVGTAVMGGEEKTWVLSMFASYDLPLGGVKVHEAAAVVDVGPEGQMVRFSHQSRSAEPAGSVTLRPVGQALADLRAGKGTCPPTMERLADLTVDSIEIAYYIGQPAFRDQFYRPVYVFHITMADGTTGEWILSAFDTVSADGDNEGGESEAAGPLSAERRAELDGLGASEVVRTYVVSPDPREVRYLCAPPLQALMDQPNYVADERHEGDVSGLMLQGPRSFAGDAPGFSAEQPTYSRDAWPIQEQYFVDYELKRDRSQALFAGQQALFVYVGRQSADSPWRILSAGTGP